jgi:ketosteroid isomerase-like protein
MMKSALLAGTSRFGLCLAVLVSMALTVLVNRASASEAKDRDLIVGLHAAYQMAVKRNDAMTMRRILDDRFLLVLGDGKRYSRADVLASAANGKTRYEKQDADMDTRSVRVFGDTAVVTARIWVKGIKDGVAFDRRVWFSDIYVRTPNGWRFAFRQASLPLHG